MSLFTDVILQNKIREDRYSKGKFYDPQQNNDSTQYSNLNKWDNYTDSKIQQHQINQLKILEKGKGIYSEQYKEVSEFIFNANEALKEISSYNNTGLQRVSASIMNSLNALLYSSKNSITKGSYYTDTKNQTHVDNDKLQKSFETNLIQLENALKELEEINSKDKSVPKHIIHKIKSLLTVSKNNKFYIKSGKSMKDYIDTKWRYAEDLAASIVSTNPKLQGLRLDKLFTDDKYSITDVLAFNTEKMGSIILNDGLGIKLNIKIEGSNKVKSTKTVKTLQEFLEVYDKLKVKETIHISVEDEEALRLASAFAVQVKSGEDQSLLTDAKRNSIFYGKNGIRVEDTELWKLYTDYHFYFSQGLNDSKESNAIENYFNYSLGTYIDRTALTKNQLYFTSEGIVTVSQWMKMKSKVLKFSNPTRKLKNGLPGTEGSYNFYSIGN